MQNHKGTDIIPFDEYKQLVDKLVNDGADVAEAVGIVNERAIGVCGDEED